MLRDLQKNTDKHVRADSNESYDYSGLITQSAMRPKDYRVERGAVSVLDMRLHDKTKSYSRASMGLDSSDSFIAKHTSGIEHIPEIRALVKDYNNTKERTQPSIVDMQRKLRTREGKRTAMGIRARSKAESINVRSSSAIRGSSVLMTNKLTAAVTTDLSGISSIKKMSINVRPAAVVKVMIK